MARAREERTFQGYTCKADVESGVIEAYVNIFGIEDDSWMNDIVHPGAFKKTIRERGPAGSNKVRVLWMHSVREVIGRPLLLEEHGRDDLPDVVKVRYPKATGGLFAKTQLVLGVQRAREAFELYRNGAMDEWSIGFEPIEEKFEEVDKRTIRHLKEIKLWEYSPVTWGANPATTTVSVKSNLLTMLEEVLKEHPEFSDRQLISAVEKRLSPELPATPQERPQQLPVHGVESTQWIKLLQLEQIVSNKLRGFEHGG